LIDDAIEIIEIFKFKYLITIKNIIICGGKNMRNRLIKKGLIIGIILLFIGVSSVPTIGRNTSENDNIENSKLNDILSMTIIVPDDYLTVQEAIDNANDYDTIFVRNGKYYENLLVNKSLNLIGENKDTTIIDGNGSDFVVELKADSISINGFTIQNGGNQNFTNDGGIMASSSDNCIFNNIINNSYCGIYAWQLRNNIYNNIVKNNSDYGIILSSNSNNVYKNIITNNSDNIYLLDSSKNKIFDNTITKTQWQGYGILMYGGSQNNKIYSNVITNVHSGIGSRYLTPDPFGYNNISNNHITDTVYWAIEIHNYHNKIIGNYMKNSYGISIKASYNIVMLNIFDGCNLNIDKSNYIKIFSNNFLNSKIDYKDCLFNRYLNNYWNKPCLIKIIIGKMGAIPWFNIDIFPAKKPY
jgi:parallel beta-helix repeat protein